jgi:hypothetical protein
MGAADLMLLMLLAMADACLLVHLHRRRQRRVRTQRMMRSLRSAIEREVGVPLVDVPAAATLVLQRAG